MTTIERTLFEKIWASHVIRDLGEGRALIHIDRHVMFEGTSRLAFQALRKMNLPLRNRNLSYGVIDHAVSTAPGRTADTWPPARYRIVEMRDNSRDFGLELFDIDDPRQGITHVIAPELGITLPGCTFVCGDSHTATNGALGAWAWGIGGTEVRHVIANQALIQRKPKTMRVNFTGVLGSGVYAKDLILYLIGAHGIGAGTGHAVEYAGPAISRLPIEGRLTLCNMSIEFGARSGMIGVDDTTIDFIAGRPYAPREQMWDQAVAQWRGMRSDDGASFDAEIDIDCTAIAPQVTLGVTPQDVIAVDGRAPDPATIVDANRRRDVVRALEYVGLRPGQPIEGVPVDVAFLGSCTNSRLSDLEAAAGILRGRKKADSVRALVAPGSSAVKRMAEARGLDKIFRDAGWEWRESGCSMCNGMNGDIVEPGQRSISTTNRNFEGRQGPQSRTHLASPAMVAAASVAGRIVDVRKFLGGAA